MRLSVKEADSVNKSYLIICVLALVILLPVTLAHQPRIAFSNLPGNATRIENEEVSQAFYGELKGEPDYYKIRAQKNFTLYLELDSPAIEGADKDYSLEVFSGAEWMNPEPVLTLRGTNSSWQPWFEDFARDNYFRGPYLRRNLNAGTYEIKVFSTDNAGKYVLVVGEQEKFTLLEILRTIFVMPSIKKNFFGKPYISAYTNWIGVVALALLLLFAAIATVIIWVVVKVTRTIHAEEKGVIVRK
jgi:hypothetical protein